MITDRISLNIALKYLNQFQQNEGDVTNILFSYKDQVTNASKNIKFPDILSIRIFLEKYAPVVTFQDMECKVTYLYELKSFTVIKNGTDKNKVYYNVNKFITSSKNINEISLNAINEGYAKSLDEVKDAFLGIKINEYILNQLQYIECGYIEIHHPEAIEKLKTLYNKYKQI